MKETEDDTKSSFHAKCRFILRIMKAQKVSLHQQTINICPRDNDCFFFFAPEGFECGNGW